MEFLQSIVAGCCFILLIKYGWMILNWAWLKPKQLEKQLKEQGFHGTSYKLLIGDLKDITKMVDQAKAKSMTFSNDIVPRILPFITSTINNFGKKSILWFGPQPAVIITEPEMVKEVMSKVYIYEKLPGNALTNLLIQGLATHEAEKWAKHRKLINPAFLQDRVKNMLPAFHLSCLEMVTKWEKMVQNEEPCEIDVWPHLQTFTSDVISRTAFGSNYEEGRKIFELQTEQTKLVSELLFSPVAYIPGWRFIPTKRNRRMIKIKEEVKSLIMGMINGRMQAIEAGEAGNKDLLGLLLESNYREIQEHGNMSAGMSMDDVVDECKMFYFAGQETTSILLVWSMILLCKNPDWQERAREEVLSMFGTRTPEHDELNHLKIVTMILNEALRLYTPAVMYTRLTKGETKLGEVSLPAGVQLLIPILFLHHEKQLWGEDVEEFNPERFHEGVSKAAKGQLAFFPFGWGPRICIGQNFAILEAKMALSMILQCFTFELSPLYTHAPHTALTLQPQYGAQLYLRRRI